MLVYAVGLLGGYLQKFSYETFSSPTGDSVAVNARTVMTEESK